MRRILLIIIRMFFELPYWMIQLKKYENTKKYSLKQRYYFVQKFINRIIKAANVKIICTGTEKLPKESGYLIAPNHQGLFDPLIIASTHKRPLSAVVKIELKNIIVVKSVIKALNAKLMDRSDLRAEIKVIRQVSNEIKEGANYIIFPEGTRSKNGNKMIKFKGGTFKAAISAKKPIVPVALIDCYKVFDAKSIKKGVAQIHYLDPIYPEEYKGMHTNEVAELVQNKIQEKMKEVIE